MIVSSLLILVTAAVLLTTGLITGSNNLLTSSIVASVAAGIALYVGARSRIRDRAAQRRQGAAEPGGRPVVPDALADTPTREIPVIRAEVFEPTDYAVDRGPVVPDVTEDHVEDQRDEPTEQRLSSVETASLMRLDAEVVVVDGRPRFHHPGCVHLVGRESESLGVAEAIDLGFTPCALCEPASRLLMAPIGGR